MQKRVVGNINELNEAARKNRQKETANLKDVNNRVNGDGCKANKTGFGRFKKFAVVTMLLIVSVFCAIGSADWIISQQEKLPGGSDSTFIYDKKTLQNYIALKGSNESETAAEADEEYENVFLQAAANVSRTTVSKAVSTYANELENAIYGRSAIYNGKPIVAVKKTADIDNAAADLPDEVLSGSLLTSYKPLSDGSVTEDDLTEAYFAEGATSGLPENAGTYAILVKIDGFEAYGYAIKIFTILPCPVTVEWSGIDFANGFTYDGTAHTVTAAAKIASGDNGNAEGATANTSVSYNVSRNDKNYDTVKNAGEYTLTAVLGSNNYVIDKNETVSFTVKKAPLTVTADDKTITYGDILPEFTASYSGFVNGETEAVLGGTAIYTHKYKQFSNVGTYTVDASGLTSENYEIAYKQGTLTVTKYGLELSWPDLIFGYDKNPHVPTAAITNPLPIGAADSGLNVSVTTGEAINAGSYTAKASVPDDGNYYIFSGETTNFTVTAKEATVTVILSETEIVFGNEAPTATINYSGVISGDSLGTPAFDYGGYEKGSDVGTYTVTVKGLANGNYDIKTTSASFTVTPYGLNIEWSDTDLKYNGKEQKPEATIKNPIAGLTAPVVTVTTTPVSAVNAGSYTAEASVADTNYYISDETKSVSFTIGKRTAFVTVNPKSITYGSEVPSFSASDLVTDNLIGSDEIMGEPTFAFDYAKGSPAGKYTVTVTFDESKINANYILSENVIYGVLTVNKASLMVTADDKTITYGDDKPDFTASYSGFVNGETSAVLSGSLEFTCDYAKGSPVGTYDVTPKGLTSDNYEIEFIKGSLTVNQKNVGIVINDNEITYGDDAPLYTYSFGEGAGLTSEEALEIANNITFICAYTKGAKAGEYEISAQVNLTGNYDFNITNGTLTVNKAQLTLKANNNAITYGDAPSANGYTFTGFVGSDTEATANITANVTFSYNYSQNDDIYDGKGNEIDYAITPTIKSFTSTNYDCSSVKSGKLTVNKLAVSLNVIERNYDSNGLTFDNSLFDGAFTSSNSQADLSKASAAVYSNTSKPVTAKNFTGTADTSKAENGYFSYSFGATIKVGSTYIIENITLKSECNYRLTSSSTYLKYKTAKIGSDYYTIEEAIKTGGSIILCGNTTTNASDFNSKITAFSSLPTVYSSTNYYTLKAGSTLLLPYNADGGEINSDDDIKTCGVSNLIYSVLVIPGNLTLNINGTLSVGGRLYTKNGNLSQAITTDHSVILNNANIVVNSGGRINSYGYLKGGSDGLLTLKANSSALDIMRIYDWLGGTEGIQIHNAGIFPFKAYSLHNISCTTKIEKSASYLAKVSINVQDSLFPSDPLTLIGDKGSMFAIDNGYIIKTATNADSDISSTELTSFTGSNQIKGQQDIITLGDNTVCHDNSITLTIKMLGQERNITTSKDYPLPISYINLIVQNGATLNLSAVSYTFYPGSSIKVENGGTLNLKDSSFVFYTIDECISDESWSKNRAPYITTAGKSDYAIDRVDAKIIDGGIVNISSSASFCGVIEANAPSSSLNLDSIVSSIKVITDILSNSDASTMDKLYIARGTKKASTTTHIYSAAGNIMTDSNSYKKANFSAGTYYSKKINGSYVWYSKNITISFDSNGGNDISPIEKQTSENGFLIDENTFTSQPSKDFYTFAGWYLDKDLTIEALGQFVYASCTLYAKWNPITYTISYKIAYDSGVQTTGTVINSNPQEYTYESNIYLSNPVDGKLKFISWYTDDKYTIPITQIVNSHGNLTIYGIFYDENLTIFTVSYQTNNEDYDDIPERNIKSTEAGTFSPPDLDDKNTDSSYPLRFEGWYTSPDLEESSKFVKLTESCVLYGKWVKKIQLQMDNGSGNYSTIKYVNPGDSGTISNDIIPQNENTRTQLTAKIGCSLQKNSDGSWTYLINDDNTLEIAQIEISFHTLYKITINLSNAEVTVTNTITGDTANQTTSNYFAAEGDKISYTLNYTESENHSFTITTASGSTVDFDENSFIMPASDITITAKSESSGCLVEGTLITLADGTQKKVEEITANDTLLVFNHYTGKFDFAKVLFNDHVKQSPQKQRVINLFFSNNKTVGIVYEHGFFDLDENKYIYITESNYTDYIGHRFYSATWNGTTYSNSIVTLDNAIITEEFIKIYSPVTTYHMNYFTENMLSMPGGIEGIFNIFEYDKDLKFDKELMEKDIEQYGEFTYEDFKDLVPEAIFNSFQTRYFTIAIGKGNLTMDRIKYYIERYTPLMPSSS